MEKTLISKNLITDAIFAVTHLYLLENQPSSLFIHLEPRFCPFSRFRFVAVIHNESEVPLPRLKLKFTLIKPETQKSEDHKAHDEPTSVSSTLTLPCDIAPGDCVAESLPSRFSELPLIVSVSLSLYHDKVDPMEASELLDEELLTACFTSFDVLLDRQQVDEFIEKDDSYDVFDDDVFIPSTTVTIKISAQNAVDITETPFNKLTVAHIQQSLFPAVTTSTPSTFSGFVVVKQTFHRVLVEIAKVVPWTDEAAFTVSLLATSGTNYSILQGLNNQITEKIKVLAENPPTRPVNTVISTTLKATIDDCDAIRFPRHFDEPYAEE